MVTAILSSVVRSVVIKVDDDMALDDSIDSLRDCEERLDALSNLVMSGVAQIGLDGYWQRVNRKLSEIAGYTEGELKRMTIQEMTYPDDLEALISIVNGLLSGDRVAFPLEIRYVHKNGTIVWVNLSMSLVRNRSGAPIYFVAVFQDITRQKQDEKTLRESMEKYAKLFKYAPGSLVFFSSLNDGKVLEVNDAFESVFKYMKDEVIGRPSVDLGLWANPADRTWVLEKLRETGAVRDCELEFRDKSGTVFIGLYAGTIIEIAGEDCLLSIVMDITARKRMEAEHARLASIVESSGDAIIGMSLNGIITNWNSGAVNIFGYTVNEALGNSITLLDPRDRRDEVVLILEKIEGGGRVKHFETERVTRDGRQIHVSLCISPIVDTDGRITGASMIARNIDEHKMAELGLLESEERLRDSEDRLRLAIESTGLGMFDLRPLTGKMILSNLFKEQLGLASDADINFTLFLAGLHPDDRDRVEQLVQRVLKPGNGAEFRDEYRTIGIQDGRERWIEARGRVYFNASGNPVRIIGTTLDITERKRVENEIGILDRRLANRAAELETANMELEAFSYSVSHDLRKPLTVISGYSQVILDMYKDSLNEECKKYVREIYEATERMERLIEALLKFALPIHSVLNREVIDLSAMAKAVIGELWITEPGRKVTTLIPEGIMVEGDANLIRVVMENLIGNAWKYTGRQEEAVIEFGMLDLSGVPTCFVRDNGVGFDMQYAEQLYIPFHRLPGSDDFRGEGIGLATVRRIIQRHCGKVWAESEPGKGATFYFTLPTRKGIV